MHIQVRIRHDACSAASILHTIYNASWYSMQPQITAWIGACMHAWSASQDKGRVQARLPHVQGGYVPEDWSRMHTHMQSCIVLTNQDKCLPAQSVQAGNLPTKCRYLQMKPKLDKNSRTQSKYLNSIVESQFHLLSSFVQVLEGDPGREGLAFQPGLSLHCD